MATPPELFEVLTRLDVIERSARNSTLHTYLQELAGAADALGTGARGSALRLLHETLRVDLAFLVAHPDEVFSCLYNRLIWEVEPRAPAYHALRATEPAANAPPPALGPEAPLLRALLGRWRTEVESRGTPWLRSLRPPEFALRGALREEYRADAPPYSRRIRWGNERRAIELLCGPLSRAPDSTPFTPETWSCVAWDRTTGQRGEKRVIDVLGPDTSPDGKYCVLHNGWGDAVFVDRQRGIRQPLQFSQDHNVAAVAYSADGTRFALAGYELDGFGFVAVYDLARCVLRMLVETQNSCSEVALSADGRLVAASGRDTLVWEVETQREVYALSAAEAALAFSEEGSQLITAELGVVRVWDFMGRGAVTRSFRRGLTHAAFSPNGERLVTGSCLCAAGSGELIAALGFVTGDYLAGGPPTDATLVGDQRVVRLENGVHVWDTRTGERLPGRTRVDFAYWHLVALHPSGMYYAITRVPRDDGPPQGRLQLIDVDRGDVLGELTGSAISCMRWSPDGSTLALGSVDGHVRLWERGAQQPVRLIGAHKGRVSDVAFVRGGSHLVSAADAEALRVRQIDSGAIVLERDLAEGDEKVHVWEGGGRSLPRVYYTWTASAHALADVERSLDPPGEHRLVIEPRDGCLALVDLTSTAPMCWFPANEELVAHPDEHIWAGGPVHLKLEGATPGNTGPMWVGP